MNIHNPATGELIGRAAFINVRVAFHTPRLSDATVLLPRHSAGILKILT
jgi:hypothetical protein